MNRRSILQSAAALSAGLATAKIPAAPPIARRRPSAVIAGDGVQLAWADWGSGPTVLLAHSWSMNSGIWRQQIGALTQAGFHVVTFDRRGHGRSQMTGRGYDLDTLADDIACIIAQLKLDEITLIGHSMGCAEAVHYLHRHGSARVRKLVLLATVTPFLTKTADNPGIDADALAVLRAKMSEDFPKWAADNAAAYFRPGTSPETVAWGVRMLIETPAPVAVACAAAFASHDFRPELSSLDLPTLIIHGDADASAPLKLTGERTAALVRGSRFIVIPGAPHGLYETDAARVNEEIVQFARQGA